MTFLIYLNSTNFLYRYIYCGRINLKVEDIYSTYLAADKYLVHKFPQALSKYIRSITNYKNCFLIFDNLNRIKFVDSKLDILPYDYVERIVQSASNLDTEYFSKINQNSLIEILKMNTLNVSEIKLLQACVDWVDSELKRTNLESNFENCSKTFNQIKPFICFSQIDILELKNFSKIKNYLSSGDILEFFFYSDSDSDSKSTSLDLTRKREKSKSSTVLFGSSAPYRDSIITLDLKVGKSFSINYLVTAYSNLEIVNSYENNKSLNVKWSYAKNIQPSQFLLKPEFPIILKPGCTYEFTFKSPNQIDSIYKAIKEDLDNVGLISKRQHCFSSIVGFILDN